ncbi:MAG: hypothetical protein R3F59_26890 [Myxococcota bacterium]
MVLVASIGCAGGERPFTGEVDGTDAVLGLVADGDRGVLYVCGGPQTMGLLNGWVSVALDGEALSGTGDGYTVSGSLAEGVLATDAGDEWTFTLSEAEGPDGAWSATEPVGSCPVGVVILERGKRVQGVACPAVATIPAQVVPVGVVADDTVQLDVQTDDGALDFVVVPATL